MQIAFEVEISTEGIKYSRYLLTVTKTSDNTATLSVIEIWLVEKQLRASINEQLSIFQCSGYQVRFTRERSPVRARAELGFYFLMHINVVLSLVISSRQLANKIETLLTIFKAGQLSRLERRANNANVVGSTPTLANIFSETVTFKVTSYIFTQDFPSAVLQQTSTKKISVHNLLQSDKNGNENLRNIFVFSFCNQQI